MSSSSEFWNWTRDVLALKALGTPTSVSNGVMINVNSTIVENFPSNDFYVSTDIKVISGTDMILVGEIRLRQLRVSIGACTSDEQYAQVSLFCQSDFHSGIADTTSYYEFDYPLYLESAYSYQSPSISPNGATSGMVGSLSGIHYGAGGYIMDLPPEFDEAVTVLNDLEASDWIDQQTSAIVIEVNTYHPLEDTYMIERFLFEFPSSGKIQVSLESTPIWAGIVNFEPVNSTAASAGIVLLFLDIANLVLLGVFLKYVISQIYSLRIRYWQWLYSYVDLVLIGCLIAYIVCRILMYTSMSFRVLGTSSVLAFPHPWIFWPMSSLLYMHSAVVGLQGGVVLVMFLRASKFLSLLKYARTGGVKRIINLCWNIWAIAIVLGIVTIGFGIGYSVIGGSRPEYSGVWKALLASASSVLNVFWIAPEWIRHPSLATGIAYVHLILVYMVLVPLVIACGVNVTVWMRHDVESEETSELEEGWSSSSGNRGNPLVVLIKQIYDRISKNPDDEEEVKLNADDTTDPSSVGIEIGRLPRVIRKHITQRRKVLQERLESEFGAKFANESFNEFSDFVSKQELGRILKENPYICAIIGETDVGIIINKYNSNSENNNNGNSNEAIRIVQNPDIREISADLSLMLQTTRGRIQMDLADLKDKLKCLDLAAANRLPKQTHQPPPYSHQ